MRLKYVVTGLMLLVSSLAYSHPLHLTFTNLEFKTQSNRWGLTIKVFSDDFAANLKMSDGSETNIDVKSKSSVTEQMLKKWLENRLQIWFDSKCIEFDTWKFDGIRVKEDASWLTYTFTAPMPTSEIKIRNTLLLDLFRDQKNLFIVTMGRYQAAHEFKNKKEETAFQLNK